MTAAKAKPTNARGVQPFRVATDPRPLGDLCICGCGRQRPRVAQKHDDPFATTQCCRAWYCVVAE